MLQLTVVRTNYLCCKSTVYYNSIKVILLYGTTAKPQSLFNDTARIVQLVYSVDAKNSLIDNLYFAIRPCLEVALVKVMHTNVSVLPSGSIRGPRRMHGNTVSNNTRGLKAKC
jgi:hypothetical protein